MVPTGISIDGVGDFKVKITRKGEMTTFENLLAQSILPFSEPFLVCISGLGLGELTVGASGISSKCRWETNRAQLIEHRALRTRYWAHVRNDAFQDIMTARGLGGWSGNAVAWNRG